MNCSCLCLSFFLFFFTKTCEGTITIIQPAENKPMNNFFSILSRQKSFNSHCVFKVVVGWFCNCLYVAVELHYSYLQIPCNNVTKTQNFELLLTAFSRGKNSNWDYISHNAIEFLLFAVGRDQLMTVKLCARNLVQLHRSCQISCGNSVKTFRWYILSSTLFRSHEQIYFSSFCFWDSVWMRCFTEVS